MELKTPKTRKGSATIANMNVNGTHNRWQQQGRFPFLDDSAASQDSIREGDKATGGQELRLAICQKSGGNEFSSATKTAMAFF